MIHASLSSVPGPCMVRRRLFQRSSSSRASLGIAALFAFALSTLAPARTHAAAPDVGALVDYGFKGFTLGLEVGLAVGYLSTGDRYEHQEWRKIVLGMGIGALAGMTTGMIIAVADYSGRGGVPVGYYVLRDANYGTWIGAAMGAIVGMLLWVDDGHPRDVVRGAAYGTLFGAIAGVAFGIIEGRNASPVRGYSNDWRLSVAPTDSVRSPGVAAVLARRF
jgi:hypothetical protein